MRNKTFLVQVDSSIAGQEWHDDIWYKDMIGSIHHVKPTESGNKLTVIGSEHSCGRTYKLFPADVSVLVPTARGYQKVPYVIFNDVKEFLNAPE